MIKKVVFDFSYVLLFPRENSYTGKLNDLNDKLSPQSGYEPLNYFYLNTELLQFLKQYKSKYDFCIFTSGKMHKLPSLREQLQEIFSEFISEKDLGVPKSNRQAFITLAEMIQVPVGEVLFIDDKKENVVAAQSAGMQIIQYIDNKQLMKELTKLLTAE